MEYNIDLLVAGCDTACRHCYVNGGPAPEMPYEAFVRCMEKLRLAFECFGDRLSFTLDNEVYHHPQALRILEYVAEHAASNYYHHGSTTGIAILGHPDREAILSLLEQSGWREVSFAIHGGTENHDRIVNRPGALLALTRAAELFKAHGFEVWLSLIASKALLRDRVEVEQLMGDIPHDNVLPVIPDYYPTPRLRRYQSIRCNAEETEAFIRLARDLGGVDAPRYCSESQVWRSLCEGGFSPDWTKRQIAFFHIDHRLDFHVGNTGSSIRDCGNVDDLSSEKILKIIESATDNYYETSEIHYADLEQAIDTRGVKRSEEDYTYPDPISCLIAMIDNTRQINVSGA